MVKDHLAAMNNDLVFADAAGRQAAGKVARNDTRLILNAKRKRPAHGPVALGGMLDQPRF